MLPKDKEGLTRPDSRCNIANIILIGEGHLTHLGGGGLLFALLSLISFPSSLSPSEWVHLFSHAPEDRGGKEGGADGACSVIRQ